MSRARRAVVIGGGVGGLATAALLARGGALVTLLERGAAVGGRAGRFEVDGFRFDTGPSWYFMPEVVEHTFDLLGARVADHLDLVPLHPVYRLFAEPEAGGAARAAGGPDAVAGRGRAASAGGGSAAAFDLTGDPLVDAATFEAREPGAGAAIAAYARAADEAYRMALDHMLYTTFQRPWRVLSEPVLRRTGTLVDLLTHTLAERVEATVTDPVLRQALGYHAVFLGSSPYRVPALYSLMSHLDLGDGVLYPRGGVYTLVEGLERLARAEGVEIRTGADVVGIEVDPAPASRRHLRRRGTARGVRLADGSTVAADLVVSDADRHHTETALLPDGLADLPSSWWEQRGPGISALLVMAGVRGPLPELAHHSLFFTRDWPGNFEAVLGTRADGRGRLSVPDPASLYVSRPTATDPTAAPPGHETLFVLVPYPAEPGLFTGTAGRDRLERGADAALDQVAAWAGIPDLRSRVVTRHVVGPVDFARDFSAWRGTALGMEHTLRQSALWRPGVASHRVPNLLHVGGGTVPGVGLPMVLIGAELVVKRLLGETSSRPLPGPLRPGFLASALPGGLWSELA